MEQWRVSMVAANACRHIGVSFQHFVDGEIEALEGCHFYTLLHGYVSPLDPVEVLLVWVFVDPATLPAAPLGSRILGEHHHQFRSWDFSTVDAFRSFGFGAAVYGLSLIHI